jgi:hypothetical protein
MILETPAQMALCAQRLMMEPVRIDVPPLSEAELAAAIVEPAARAGLSIEPGLASRIVADLKDEPGQLPLLQFVMSELYAEEPRGVLSREKYERLGGIAMVERKCERAYRGSGLSSLSRLVNVAEAGTYTPQPAQEASVANREMLDAFVAAGVLVREDTFVRFSSRIFADRWPRLREFIEGNREFLLWRQRLDQLMAVWQANRRAINLLTREALSEAQDWARRRPEDLNREELAYIEVSLQALQQDLNQRSVSQQQEKKGFLWFAVVMLALIGGAVYLYRSQAGFPDQGWCYQKPSIQNARTMGAPYGAACFESQRECDSDRMFPRGSACAFIGKLDLNTWGGVAPSKSPAPYKYWFRSNLPKPLPPPFPQP